MQDQLNQARQYLARVVPWDGHHVGIHYVTRTGEGRPYWSGRPVTSVDQGVRQIEWLLKNNPTADIYVALASQIEAEVKQGKIGRPFKVAKRARTNAANLRSLFMDIDVKPGAYSSPNEALAALYEFCSVVSIPRPTCIVLSGSGGLHVYWCLEQQLTVAEWQPLAHALVKAAKQHGLIFDSQCTVDAVRILRVPGTSNWKSSPPKPVKLGRMVDADIPNDIITEALAPYMDELPLAPVGKFSDADFADMTSAGAPTGAAPRDIDKVGEICPWIQDTLSDNGAINAQPLWFLSLRIALFCKNETETAHRLSKGHPTYHPDEVNETLARLRQKPAGFPSCRAIQESGAFQCGQCARSILGQSPLTPKETIAIPDSQIPGGPALPSVISDTIVLPSGYGYADGTGMVYMNITNDDGTMTKVFPLPVPIFDPWVTDRRPHILHFRTTLGAREKHVEFPLSAANEKSATMNALSTESIVILPNDQKLAFEFMASFLKTLREQQRFVREELQFGWVYEVTAPSEEKLTGFAYGGTRYGVKGLGNTAASPPQGAMRDMYMPKGGDAIWRQGADLLIRERRPAIEVILASAFAGPLVEHCGHKGLVLGAYSPESGVGKSTAMRFAQAVWGRPTTAMAGLSDTENSVLKRMGDLRHLPVYWDELKTAAETDKFVQLMFQLTGGKERSRLGRDIKLRTQHEWATMLTYASNDSLYDAVAKSTRGTDAGHYRMFEFMVPPMMDASAIDLIEHLSVDLDHNYGQIGAQYLSLLVSNFDDVKERLRKFQLHFRGPTGVQARPEERFWVASAACIMTGAVYAKEWGFINFDTRAMLNFLKAEFLKLRARVAQSPNDMGKSVNILHILGAFLADKRAKNMLVTDKIWTGRGRPAANAIKIKNDGSSEVSRLETLQVQYGEDDKILRISDMALTDWLKQKGIPKTAFVSGLKAKFNAETISGRIGAGTRLTALLQEIQWHVPLSGSSIVKLLEPEEDT